MDSFIEILRVLLPFIAVGAIAVFIVLRLKAKLERGTFGKKKTEGAQNQLDSLIPLGMIFGGVVAVIVSLIFPIPLLPTLSLGAGFGALAGYFAYEHYSEKKGRRFLKSRLSEVYTTRKEEYAVRKVNVSPYNGQWALLFAEEAEKIKLILSEELVAIHHFGSTSVPGLAAKPTIDILAVVKDIELIDSFNEEFLKIGYTGKGENGIAGRRYFQKGKDDRTHHLHIYGVGSPEIERHLVFRDYLREHPEAAKEYGELKSVLSKRFPYDIDLYINGKEALASKIQVQALEWQRSRKQ